MQSVLDLPNLSSWYARPRLPWEQFSKCKVAYKKAMYILVIDQSICTLISNLSGRPDIFLGSGTLKIYGAKYGVQKTGR